MKKMIFSAIMLTFAMSATYAQTAATPPANKPAAATQADEKVKVDPASLPDAVKKTLAGDAYKDWKINAAWTTKTQPDVYMVELKSADNKETRTVSIDKDGNVK